MPNRILRAELLESEAWLSLKDNADRAAYIACLLTVDTFGSMPAGPQRLVRLWRPYGIDTPEKAAKAFADLIDVDLVRRYVSEGKPYLYVPRFRQSCRWLGHVWPLSPWATDEEKQRHAKKTHVEHMRPPADHGGPQAEVGVEVGVGVDVKATTLSGYAPDVSLPEAKTKGKGNGVYREAALRVLETLNLQAGRRYHPVVANLEPIIARLREGYTESELRAIAVVKARQWTADEKMAQYLRPATLYNRTKCAQYRAELPANRLENHDA